jgi:hypothetical protein
MTTVCRPFKSFAVRRDNRHVFLSACVWQDCHRPEKLFMQDRLRLQIFLA